MLFRDAIAATVTGLLVITPLALVMLLMQLIHKLDGVGTGTLLKFVPLLTLYYQPYLIPICVLVACAAAYGRFAGDREFTAVMTCGVAPRVILWPAILIGLVAMLPSFYTSFETGPDAYLKKDQMVREVLVDVLNNPPPGSRELSFPSASEKNNRGIHLSYRQAGGGVFEGLVIMETEAGQLSRMLTCERAELRFDEASGKISLARAVDSLLLQFEPDGSIKGAPMRGDLALLEAEFPLSGEAVKVPPKAEPTVDHFASLAAELSAPAAERKVTVYEFLRRLSFVISPLLLALIGALTGLLLAKESRIVQVGAAMIIGVVMFFGLQVAVRPITNMGLPGPVALGIGAAAIVLPMLLVTFVLLKYVNRAREIRSWTSRMPTWLRHLLERRHGHTSAEPEGEQPI